MFRRNTCTASTAMALILPASAAMADLTAAQVWADWQDYIESAGYALTASEIASAGTLTVTDIAMSMDLGSDGSEGSAAVGMDALVFTENADGSVSVAMPEDTLIDIAFVPEGQDDEVDISLVYSQTEPVMTATGVAGNVVYDYAASTVKMALDGVEVSGVILTEDIARLSIVAQDMAYVMSNQTGDVRTVSQTMSASRVDYDIFFEDPEGDGTFRMTGDMEGLAFEGAGDVPLEVDPQDFNKMLADGLVFDGTFEVDRGGYDMTFNSPDGGGTLNSASEGGSLRVAMSSTGLDYDVRQLGVTLNMLLTDLPIPISLSAREIATDILMPLQKSPDDQDFGFGVALRDFSMSDALWGLFDATGQLPRDPATLVVDLSGKARVLFDFLDPAQAAVLEQSGAAPGELNALTLNALELDALGAKLTGAGDFTFDNTDTITFDGLPRPAGAVDLTLVGGNGLLDKLVAMGFVPDDQAMGARMMMGLFAVPGDGADTLESRIEINEEGHVLANGQRLR